MLSMVLCAKFLDGWWSCHPCDMMESSREFCFSFVMYPGNEHGYGTDEWGLSGSIRACRPSALVHTDVIVGRGRRFVFSPTAEDAVTLL